MKKKQLNGYCNLHKRNTKKQTAVEWLQENLSRIKDGIPEWYLLHYESAFSEALQMEREQHKETWFDSTRQFANDARMDNKIDFEIYYTKNYTK